jgi:hypothetical protein
MSLIAPLFLFGLLAIGLPFWLHRLQTQNPKRLPISSAMLLDQSERRLHTQKKLRFLVLLALRTLFLALLALAFAQPVWRLATGARLMPNSHLHVIIVDTSLSMSAPGRIEAARTEAEKIINGMGSGDRALIVTANSVLEMAAVTGQGGGSGATGDKAALLRVLPTITPGASRLEYALAVSAVDNLAGTSELPVIADLISDFQSSGMSQRFADLIPHSERGRKIELQLHQVATDAPPNWAISSIKQSGTNIDVTVSSRNSAAKSITVTLEVNAGKRGEVSINVPANGEAQFRFADVALNMGDNRVIARLGTPDAIAADDSGYVVLQGGGPQIIPLLTADARGESGTFVGAALTVAAARYRAAPTRVSGFDTRTLERFRFVVVDDAGAVDAALATALRRYVESGGALLLASGARAGALDTLPVSGEAVRGVTVRNADPLSIGRVDGAHALLVNTRGWQNVSVARMLKLTPGKEDRVLVATEDGEPLLLEQRLGSGRLLVLSTSLENTWSDLPVQPVFVSFMAEAAAWLAGGDAFGARQIAGSILPLAQAGASVGQVVDPDGHELLSLSATRNAQSVRLRQSGFYQVITPARESLIAVNVDARETDLTPIDKTTLDGWRNAAKAAETVAPAASSAQSSAGALPLARWLLALMALVIIAESFVGNWLLRRSTKVMT